VVRSLDAAVPAPQFRVEPKFGVIVVNWKNSADTIRCLDSLGSAELPPERVVVVDNGSGDGSIDRLREWARSRGIHYNFCDPAAAYAAPSATPPRHDAHWLTLLDARVNLGFAGGNNIGLALLEREEELTHFLLLNNDALIAREFFTQIAAALERWPNAGLCIGTIFEEPRRDRVWYAGGRFVPSRALAEHNHQLPATGEPMTTDFVTGCAMVIARPVLARVGKLAPCYFPGYMEDAEYSWRVRECGYDLVYAPRAVVYHKVGTSFGARSMSPLTAYHQSRHRVFFARRNLRGMQRLTALAYMAVTKPGRAVVDALSGRPTVGWAVLRGTVAGFVTPLASC